jgi:hypothetical protein
MSALSRTVGGATEDLSRILRTTHGTRSNHWLSHSAGLQRHVLRRTPSPLQDALLGRIRYMRSHTCASTMILILFCYGPTPSPFHYHFSLMLPVKRPSFINLPFNVSGWTDSGAMSSSLQTREAVGSSQHYRYCRIHAHGADLESFPIRWRPRCRLKWHTRTVRRASTGW